MPVWSPDGKQIFFVKEEAQQGEMMVVDFQRESTPSASAPRTLFKLQGLDWHQDYYPFPGYDISPDGRHFLMTKLVEDWSQPRHLNVTTNFFGAIREKVPTE